MRSCETRKLGNCEDGFTEVNYIDFAKICRENSIALCYLFGSHAEGYADGKSDMDIGAVFFDGQGNVDWLKQWQHLKTSLESFFPPRKLDLVFLRQAPIQLQWEAIHKGKLIYCADEIARTDFEEQVVSEWLDFEPFLKRFQRDMVEGILKRCKMLNNNVLLTQLSFVQRSCNRLQRLARLARSEFLANQDNVDLAHHHLRLAIEAAADMGRHIIARMGWGQSMSYIDVFECLGTYGVLSPYLAPNCEALASFRNLLVHRYPLVKAQELYQRVQRHVPDIEDFIQEITQYLQKQGIP
ncbi:DUF86 domain-containing protein [bacterium]|nr:DUF86 domain-containing protein [bacterium]